MASFTFGSSSSEIADMMEKEKQAALDKANEMFRQRVVATRELTNPGPIRPGIETVLIDGTERPGGLPQNVDLTESRWW